MQMRDTAGYPLQTGQQVRIQKGKRALGEVVKLITDERHPEGVVQVELYDGGLRTRLANTVTVQRRQRHQNGDEILAKQELDAQERRDKWRPVLKRMAQRKLTK